MPLTVILLKELFMDKIKGYALDKILDKYVSSFHSKGKNIEEQFIYCINSALMRFSQKYQFEYNIDKERIFFESFFEQGEFLSDETIINILKTTVYLEFDKKKLDEWLDLINRIISEEELTFLRDYILMKNSGYRNSEAVYPRILTAKPPLPPEEYLSRKESEIIIEKLRDSKKLVLVNGIGGIGKSTVCRKIFHELNDNMDERPLAWIVYHDKNLLDDMKKQMFYPKDGPDWEKRFTQFLQQDIDKEAIIFIDNLNVTEDEEEYLSHLANARCNIVCTSRIEKFSHYETVLVDYLDEKQCIELFYKYYKREYNEKKIRNIISKSGRHTLVIEILGKIGEAEGYSLEELENKLIQDGFDLEGIAFVENKEDTLIGHLCRTFNFKKINEIQKQILYCMAVLPIQWIPYDLRRWLNLQNNYNFNYLIKYAWLQRSENGYYMHPVIKEVVKRSLNISKDTILRLLEGIGNELSYKENPSLEKSKLYISFAEAILDYLQGMKNQIISQTAYNISMVYGQFGEFMQSQKYINYTIEIEEEQSNSEELLASAYNHRGFINYYTYHDKEAEDDYLEAYRLRSRLKNHKNIAETTASLALLYQGMWSVLNDEEEKKKSTLLIRAKVYEKKSIKMFERIFVGVLHPNLASAYNNMAIIYYSSNEFDMAVYYYRKAERIRIQLSDDIYMGDLAVTYKGLCDSYIGMAEQTDRKRRKLIFLKIALINLDKGLDIRKKEIKNGNQRLGIDEILKTRQYLENEIRLLRIK